MNNFRHCASWGVTYICLETKRASFSHTMLQKAEQVSLNSALHRSKTVHTCWDSFEEKNSSEDLIPAEGMLQKVSHLTEPPAFLIFSGQRQWCSLTVWSRPSPAWLCLGPLLGRSVSLPLSVSLEMKNQKDLLLASLLQLSCKPHTVELFICLPTHGQ